MSFISIKKINKEGETMLSRKIYFIREHVGLLKLTDTYDILAPETQEQLGVAKEKPKLFSKY